MNEMAAQPKRKATMMGMKGCIIPSLDFQFRHQVHHADVHHEENCGGADHVWKILKVRDFLVVAGLKGVHCHNHHDGEGRQEVGGEAAFCSQRLHLPEEL